MIPPLGRGPDLQGDPGAHLSGIPQLLEAVTRRDGEGWGPALQAGDADAGERTSPCGPGCPRLAKRALF